MTTYRKLLTVVPAYGRDYQTAKQVKEAWDAGKDFIIQNMFDPDDGRYINKSDADRADIGVMVRFCRGRYAHIGVKTTTIMPASRGRRIDAS